MMREPKHFAVNFSLLVFHSGIKLACKGAKSYLPPAQRTEVIVG